MTGPRRMLSTWQSYVSMLQSGAPAPEQAGVERDPRAQLLRQCVSGPGCIRLMRDRLQGAAADAARATCGVASAPRARAGCGTRRSREEQVRWARARSRARLPRPWLRGRLSRQGGRSRPALRRARADRLGGRRGQSPGRACLCCCGAALGGSGRACTVGGRVEQTGGRGRAPGARTGRLCAGRRRRLHQSRRLVGGCRRSRL